MKRIIMLAVAVLTMALLPLGCVTPANAYTVSTVGPVSRSVTCNGYPGVILAWFQVRSDNGTMRPYRGGWRMDRTYNIRQVQAIGVVGSNSYANPAVSFSPAVQGASQYVPSGAPFAHASYVSVSTGITLSDGSKCVGSIPASAAGATINTSGFPTINRSPLPGRVTLP